MAAARCVVAAGGAPAAAEPAHRERQVQVLCPGQVGLERAAELDEAGAASRPLDHAVRTNAAHRGAVTSSRN